MNYFDVLFHPTLIMATLLYTILTISFEILYQHFLHRIQPVAVSHWIAKHVGSPFIHVLLLVAFIYMSYPVLYGYGLENLPEHQNISGEAILPTLTELLNFQSGQTMKMINTLFIISILLPLIPVINRFIALILPLQAIAGSAVLYSWLGNYTGIDYSLNPGMQALALIVLFSFIAELIARALSKLMGQTLNNQYHTHDMEKVIHKSTLLILQVPILLIYTLNIR